MMATQILKPKDTFILQGSWGKKTYFEQTKGALYSTLHRELIDSGILPKNTQPPSNKNHGHVTMAVMECSWDPAAKKWTPDTPTHIFGPASTVKPPVIEESCVVTRGWITLYAHDISGKDYAIERHRCDTAAKLLGWLLHLSKKKWFTPTLQAKFILAVSEAAGIPIER